MPVRKEELIERATALAPVIAAEAQKMDDLRSITDDALQRLIDAELIQILVPRQFGGHEMDLHTMSDVVLPIAEASPAIGWLLAFYIGHAWVHALFPEKAQEEVFRDKPFALTPGTIAPVYKFAPVSGGYVLNGRSNWASGVNHAEWANCVGFVDGANKADGPVICYVPRSDLEVVDNWHTLGMRATGSNEMIARDVFVPDYRVMPVLPMMEGRSPGSTLHAGALYSLPLGPVMLCEMLPPMVGAHSGAAKELLNLTLGRHSTNTGSKIADKVAAQMRLGRSEIRSTMIRRLLDAFIDDVQSINAHARSLNRRLALRTNAAMIAEMCREGVSDIVRGAGGDSLRDGTKMQRYHRDVSILSLHNYFDVESLTEAYGRTMLGLEAGLLV
jgi:3-hydroxy-9,10-secoandrosta-1,3,5(10)-triene-9,17-dione monooxygenase